MITPRKDKTVLIVEGDPDLRTTTKILLEVLSPNILDAHNGLTALKLLKRNRIDVVLTEALSPQLGDVEFFNELHQNNKDIQIIFYSASADKKNLIAAIKLGVFAFIEKPADNKLLLKTVHDAFVQCDQTEVAKKIEKLNLTAVNKSIIELIFKGLPNKEIAKILSITEPCVKYHVGNLLEEFQAANRGELQKKIRSF